MQHNKMHYIKKLETVTNQKRGKRDLRNMMRFQFCQGILHWRTSQFQKKNCIHFMQNVQTSQLQTFCSTIYQFIGHFGKP